MSKVKAVIIEDEIPAARLLHSMVSGLRPEWEISILAGSVEEAVAWFAVNPHPDIIFLDIQLADGNSFDFLSVAKPDSFIIFTTAYDEYAIRAFTVNSIDYILKPVDEKRLLAAIVKYESFLSAGGSKSEDYIETLLETLQKREKHYRTRFMISTPNKIRSLQVSDIAYFYSENKATSAVAFDGQEYVIDLSLTKLMEQLDPNRFFRANRQIIVSIDSIVHAEPYFNGKIVVAVKPPCKSKVTISEEKITSFKLWLNY